MQSRPYHLQRDVAIYKKSEYIRLIKEWGGGLAGKRVLKTDLYEEAFGGDGFLGWLSSQKALAYGADVSVVVTQTAAKRLNVKYPQHLFCSVSDARRLAFANEAFDIVVSGSTLDNMPREGVLTALKELRRVIKPGSPLILTLDNGHNPLYVLGYWLEKVLKTQGYYQAGCFTVPQIKDLARQAGFRVQEIRSIVHLPTPFNKMALCLDRLRQPFLRRWLRRQIMRQRKPGLRANSRNTGWFIAAKLV